MIRKLTIAVIVFFLVVSTRILWISMMGAFAIIADLVLLIAYTILVCILIVQIVISIRHKFSDKRRNGLIYTLAAALVLIAWKPDGLIKNEAFGEKNLLVAGREGVANCYTSIILKTGNAFTEKSMCFGVTKTTGEYIYKNDTIYFINVEPGRDASFQYKYGLIKMNKDIPQGGKLIGSLLLFENYSDTIGSPFGISKNELK